MHRILRALFGHDVSTLRERKAAEVSQVQMDSDRTKAESDRVLARTHSLLDADRRIRLTGIDAELGARRVRAK